MTSEFMPLQVNAQPTNDLSVGWIQTSSGPPWAGVQAEALRDQA